MNAEQKKERKLQKRRRSTILYKTIDQVKNLGIICLFVSPISIVAQKLKASHVQLRFGFPKDSWIKVESFQIPHIRFPGVWVILGSEATLFCIATILGSITKAPSFYWKAEKARIFHRCVAKPYRCSSSILLIADCLQNKFITLWHLCRVMVTYRLTWVFLVLFVHPAQAKKYVEWTDKVHNYWKILTTKSQKRSHANTTVQSGFLLSRPAMLRMIDV